MGLNNPKAIGLMAFMVAAGITILFLGCALDKEWWPLLVLLPYFLIPIPIVMLGSFGGNNANVVNTDGILSCALSNWGQFLAGAILSCTFALHWLLFHLDMIQSRGFWLSELSNVVILGSAGAYGYWTSLQSQSEVSWF